MANLKGKKRKATAAAAAVVQFQRFDIVTDDSDHHYANNNEKHFFTNQKGSIFKKIMEEWKILENHLPESIYVRVYEGRIDLLRAAIVWMDYNEDVFLLSCKTVMYTISNPPKNFEVLVSYHYRARGETILDALKAYGDGLGIVGTYQRDGHCSSCRVEVSKKFEDEAKKVYCDLEKVLREKGIYVAKIEKREREEERQSKEEKIEVKKKGQRRVKKEEILSTGSKAKLVKKKKVK
ncbi:hypothetical protein LguiA_031277 [Lonicera macranthoides]